MRSQQWDNNGGNVQFQGTATNPIFHMHVEHQDKQSRDRCLDYFAVTDPRDIKMIIHQTRGAALKESYGWILRHPQFQHWRDSNDSQILWIKGDPGKGKTMLLCGFIDELRPTTKLADSQAKTFLSFFFCQATVPKLSNAHAVPCGLIYMLVKQQPLFLTHLRNHVQQRESLVDSQSILSLELQDNAEFVSEAIEAYIADRTSKLESLQDNPDREYVRRVLREKAEGTFFWVALVVQKLQDVDSWDVRQVVDDILKGLDDLYTRMINHIKNLEAQSREYCQLVLSATTLAYRPLQLLELGAVSGLPEAIAGNAENIEKIVKKSGSFLTVREKTIFFVHQSAKDYLIGKAGLSIFPSGSAAAHRRMFTHSLQVMNKTLRRDMYGLRALGTPIDQAKPPEPDPLTAGGVGIAGLNEDLEDHGPVDVFLRERYLYWLEALSLLRRMTEGIVATQKLELLLRGRPGAGRLQELVQDAYRFIRYHRGAIENSPLQAYGSALVFSPTRSMIKQLFQQERANNLAIVSTMGDDWDAHTGACLQTLEGHDDTVHSVAFHDSSRIASGPGDNMIKIWDTHTGARLQTLEGHNSYVTSVVFSHDSSRVASGSYHHTIKIWDAHTGACLQTLDIASAVSNIFFNANGSSLHSDIGIVALRGSPTPAPTTSTEIFPSESQSLPATQQSQTPEYQGYGISSDGTWIPWRSQNWLWLPPMYRPTCSAVGQSGLALVLGCQSGRVLIFGFAAEDCK
ncbi:hypothetical protein ACN38_g9662 [Penicillium nordicum]|uniref:Nephrocystin 3-like N-terminal domain-containing protein n=1 Tax=Penicillium nordicum TaxID=229535 RepID=A0A0M8NU72_9EURO|nr:hypothetical protein ACN38_g9662 [Penicillium nordicum]